MSDKINWNDPYNQALADNAVKLIKRIQDALGTAETGDALVEVARNAHRAELELASMYENVEEI